MSSKKNLANLIPNINQGSDNKTCVLKFSMCDDKYPIYKLESSDLKEFIKLAKILENTQWKNIKNVKGINYEVLHNFKRPNNISNDITIRSMRLSKKARLIGYRDEEYFYIIWFDNNHLTC